VTYVDWIVFAILVLSAGLAWMRGFMRELLSIGGWIIAGVVTFIGVPAARPISNQYVPDPLFADIAAGIVIFVVTLIVCSIIGHFVSKRVQGSMLGPVDRSLGLVFGLVRGALVVSAIALVLFDYVWPAPTEPPPEIANAMSRPMAAKGADLLRALIPESLLAKAKTTTADAQQQGQMVINASRMTGLLPEQLLPPPGPAATGESSGSAVESGYKDAERKDLKRLIQGTQ
jgi:membrane protein required for colicin V production